VHLAARHIVLGQYLLRVDHTCRTAAEPPAVDSRDVQQRESKCPQLRRFEPSGEEPASRGSRDSTCTSSTATVAVFQLRQLVGDTSPCGAPVAVQQAIVLPGRAGSTRRSTASA